MKEMWKNDKTLVIKKCISILLVVFGMIFILVNKGVYYSDHEARVKISKKNLLNPVVVEFQGDKTFEQQFRGWDGSLDRISMRFSNQGNQAATGNVILQVLDGDGRLLQASEKKLSKIRTTKPVHFRFDDPVTFSREQWYTLRVIVEEAQNPQGFGVFTYPQKGKLFGQLTIDGEENENRLGVTFSFHYYNMAAVRDMYVFFLLALVFICFPFSRVDQLIRKTCKKEFDTSKLVSRLFFFASPVLCYMMADRFNGFYLKQMLKRMDDWAFVFNMLIYVMLWIVLYTIINRTQYAAMTLLLLVFAATIANYYVWVFRGCPILATDIQSAKTAMNVAANFSYSLDLTGVWGVVYIITFESMLLSLKGYKGAGLKRRAVCAGICLAVILAFNGIFFHSNIIRNLGIKAEVWHPQQKYAKNGTALSFVLSWSYTKVERPSGYSAKKIAEIVEQYPSDKVSDPDEVEFHPNIIAVMNESLADLRYNGKLELSEDYLPFLHSMKDNVVKGKLYVSIEGANTANSEFEFLTGNTMAFLPFRCIPYNLYINRKTPSMAQNLRVQGYAGMNACHPYLRSGWNRANVYPLLGFEEFLSDEYYVEHGNDSLVRNYISDASDFKQLIEDYEASRLETDAPFYAFNVTMQNHGGYDGKRGTVDAKIKIEDAELYHPEAEQYINLAKLSDDAIKDLIEYFQRVEEPTLIVMFGDHQPPVSNSFYSAQFGHNVNSLPIKKQAAWYSTPYFIWANYDIEEKEMDMSANYLSSYVQQLAGLKLTGYNKYLLDLQKTIPAISAVCYMDTDGNLYEPDEKSKYSDLIHEYQMVQYNELFDEDERYDEFFFLKE